MSPMLLPNFDYIFVNDMVSRQAKHHYSLPIFFPFKEFSVYASFQNAKPLKGQYPFCAFILISSSCGGLSRFLSIITYYEINFRLLTHVDTCFIHMSVCMYVYVKVKEACIQNATEYTCVLKEETHLKCIPIPYNFCYKLCRYIHLVPFAFLRPVKIFSPFTFLFAAQCYL